MLAKFQELEMSPFRDELTQAVQVEDQGTIRLALAQNLSKAIVHNLL